MATIVRQPIFPKLKFKGPTKNEYSLAKLLIEEPKEPKIIITHIPLTMHHEAYSGLYKSMLDKKYDDKFLKSRTWVMDDTLFSIIPNELVEYIFLKMDYISVIMVCQISVRYRKICLASKVLSEYLQRKYEYLCGRERLVSLGSLINLHERFIDSGKLYPTPPNEAFQELLYSSKNVRRGTYNIDNEWRDGIMIDGQLYYDNSNDNLYTTGDIRNWLYQLKLRCEGNTRYDIINAIFNDRSELGLPMRTFKPVQ